MPLARLRPSRAGRSAGSRPIFDWSSVISRNTSACRRNSSATMGGWVEMVETTVTRTPRRCMASTKAAEVSVAREQDHMVDGAGDLHGVHRKLDVHVALDLFGGRFGPQIPLSPW